MMPIRNTDVHNLCGWTPGFCYWHWWQLSFVSRSWCVCISAQSSNRKACRAENDATVLNSSPQLIQFNTKATTNYSDANIISDVVTLSQGSKKRSRDQLELLAFFFFFKWKQFFPFCNSLFCLMSSLILDEASAIHRLAWEWQCRFYFESWN